MEILSRGRVKIGVGRFEIDCQVAMSSSSATGDFRFEQHGEVTLIVPSQALENMDPTLITEAAELLVQPLHDLEVPLVLVDLSEVTFFGSAFLSLLLKCWNVTTAKGGQMALSGVRPRARELLHLTSLDMVWPIYQTRHEAFEALLAD